MPPSAAADLPSWRDTLSRAAALAAAAAPPSALSSALSAASAAAGAGGASSGQASSSASADQDDEAAAPAAPPPAPALVAVPGEGRLLDGFLRAFHGVSPALVEELCEAAGVAAGARPGSLEEP